MNKKHLLLGLMLAFFKPAFAQDQTTNTTFTLQEAVNFALTNSETIKKSKLDEQSAEYKIREVKGSGLPQLNASGQVLANPAIPTQLIPNVFQGKPEEMIPVQFGTKFNATGGFDLQQLIFRKSFFVGLEAASTTADLYRLRVQMNEEDVIYNVSSAYLQVLQTKEQFNSIDANFNRLEQLEKILKLQYQNDVATKVQLNRVTVNKTNLENQRQTLLSAFEQQKNSLKFFMGLPIDQEIELAGISGDVLNASVLAPADVNEVLANRIDYKLLTTQRELNNLNVKNIRAGYYPSLSAFANYNANAQRNEFSFLNPEQQWFNSSAIGIRLSVPIFDGFQRKNQVKQAQLEMQKTEQDMQRLNQSTNMALKNAASQMQASLSSITAQERNVALAKEVYKNTNELYKEGLSPLTEVLDTELSLREAETNLNNERLKYQLAQLRFLQVKGELRILTQ